MIVAPQIERFLDVWSDSDLLDNISTALTCTEADALADLLRFFDYDESADVLIGAHSVGDDEGDDHFREPTRCTVEHGDWCPGCNR